MDNKIDLVSLPVKSFWKLSIPIIAFCIFNAIYGIVDMLWISKISVEAFFALGISIPIVSFIFSFGDSLGQGTNSIMSRFIGTGDYESAYNALIHGMILSNIIWVFLILCLLLGHEILFYLNKLDSYIMVFDYLMPIVFFAYTFILINLFSETLQAEGNSKIPTILILASNILNIILDPIFIFNLNLGLRGAAYATVLSASVAFIVFIFYYVSGRTKVPLSLKYFKFRSYIFIEIIKVALPNFLNDALWCIAASFLNSMLIMSIGQMGPILYSVSNKIRSLLEAPVRGYGRALMSVTGHLFGARKFDGLNDMYNYVLKVSFITTLIEMIVFIFARDYVFALFSITLKNEVFWIAVGGSIIMFLVPFSMISSKMLDGFGKSLYSLMFTAIKIVLQMSLIYGLFIYMGNGSSVLIGLLITEIVMAMVYYLFLRHLFNHFSEEFINKATVKNFKDEDTYSYDSENRRVVRSNVHKVLTRIPLLLAVIALVIIFINVVYLPIEIENYSEMFIGTISFIIGSTSVYLMERLNKPKLAVIGFFINALVIVSISKYGYISTILFIFAGLTLLAIKRIIKARNKTKVLIH